MWSDIVKGLCVNVMHGSGGYDSLVHPLYKSTTGYIVVVGIKAEC